MSDKERIVLEKAEDGERWRMHTEGGDAEGHAYRSGRDVVPDAEGHSMRGKLSIEPDGQADDGEQLFRLTGGDVEGHTFRSGR